MPLVLVLEHGVQLFINSFRKWLGCYNPISIVSDYTLSRKRNATNLAAVIFYVLLIGPRVLGDSFIRHVIDLFGVFIQVE